MYVNLPWLPSWLLEESRELAVGLAGACVEDTLGPTWHVQARSPPLSRTRGSWRTRISPGHLRPERRVRRELCMPSPEDTWAASLPDATRIIIRFNSVISVKYVAQYRIHLVKIQISKF